ncbi:hypothetical protein [Bacillus sp. UNC41MFS5]|uniref:hypothetical protein n=1 Tax=Bacillus sp. UNC41MFS5 TaxID=1449046 RepID=UPI003FA4B7E1
MGHTGEYIASKIFEIELVESTSNKGIDGFFSGLLSGKSVNIKFYTKQECLLDITPNFHGIYKLITLINLNNQCYIHINISNKEVF